MTDLAVSQGDREILDAGDTSIARLFDRRTVDRLLTTTRSVRMRLDLARPVDPEIINDCLELAIQAPSADNGQKWRWLIVTDPEKRAIIARHYQYGWRWYHTALAGRFRRGNRSARASRVLRSVQWLADNLASVPVLAIPCVVGRAPRDPTGLDANEIAKLTVGVKRALYYGSIYPAVWSFQLALRSRGLGSVMTVMHLPFEAQIAEELGIPPQVTQAALVAVAHTKGTHFSPAERIPAQNLTYWNQWGVPLTASEEASVE